MNKQQKKEMRQRQSTRDLMGITELTESGAITPHGETACFLFRADNLSVLPPEGIKSRIRSLTGLLSGMESVQILALNSRESFQTNRTWYQERSEKEPNPVIRELLMQDKAHLDRIQATMATAREFALVIPITRQGGESIRSVTARILEDIRNHGFTGVRLAMNQDIRRLLSVYYTQDVTTDYFESFDGERAVYG